MNLRNITFNTEEINFTLKQKSLVREWLGSIISAHTFKLVALNYIFCSDDYLLEINKEYLEHDYYTDIITFDQSEENGLLEGDIFISIHRVQENAIKQETSFENELSRVLAHGLLHLLGFKDKTDEEQKVMRQEEDKWISKLNLSN